MVLKSVDVEKPRTAAIVGAGAAGLCAARHCLRDGLQVTLFEQQLQLGGTWVYSDEVDVFSSLYERMNTNLPKEIMRFEDFPFETGQRASFVPHQQVRAYLEEYAAPVKPFIKRCDDKWAVNVQAATEPEGQENDSQTSLFDLLFVCHGHFVQARLPDLATRLALPWIHCHNYRRPQPYKDQTVAIVGAGPSGTDIAIQVFLLYNMKTEFGLAENVVPMPEMVGVGRNGRSIVLEGGQELDGLDQVIFCTGYKYTVPLITGAGPVNKPLVQAKADGSYVAPLYQHLVHPDYPRSLFFVGLCWSLIPFVLFDHQMHYALALAMGRVEVPDKRDMDKFEEDRLKELASHGSPVNYYHRQGSDQWAHFELLSRLADRPHELQPVVRQIYDDVEKQRKHNLTTYKSHYYSIEGPNSFRHLALDTPIRD